MAALDAADRLTPASGSSTGPIWSILTVGLGGGGVCGVVVWPHHTAFGRHLFRPSSASWSCGHDDRHQRLVSPPLHPELIIYIRGRVPVQYFLQLGLEFMLKSMVAARCYFFGHNKFGLISTRDDFGNRYWWYRQRNYTMKCDGYSRLLALGTTIAVTLRFHVVFWKATHNYTYFCRSGES